MNHEQELLFEAAELLEADLVWSSDLYAIRYHLATWLRTEAMFTPNLAAVDLSEALLDTFHNEIAVS